MQSAGEAVKDVVNNTVALDMNDIEFMDQTMQFDGSELEEVCDQNAPRDGTMELTEADLKPVNKGTMIYDPTNARQQTSVFRPVSNGVEGYETFEQARMFLERYPEFDRIGKDQLRSDFFYHLIDVYESLPREVQTGALGRSVDMKWEENFEKALTITQNDLGIDVRVGDGVKDVLLIEPEGKVRSSTTELDRVDIFLEERMRGWDDKLRIEFKEIWSADVDRGYGLEDKGTLEIRFDQTIEHWLENYRGMPTDVVEKIMALDIPREDLPRHVDNAIYNHGLWPSETANFLDSNVAGRSVEPESVRYGDADLMLDVDTYIEERLGRLSSRAKFSNSEIGEVREVFKASAEAKSLKMSGEPSVASQEDLQMSYEYAIESMLARKIDRMYDFQLGYFDKNMLSSEIMDAARNSSMGLEAALGVIEIGLQHGQRGLVNAFDYLDGRKRVDSKPQVFEVSDGAGGRKRITVPEGAKSGGRVNFVEPPLSEHSVTRVFDMSEFAPQSERDVTVRVDAGKYQELSAEKAAAEAERGVTQVYYVSDLIREERTIAARNRQRLTAADEAYLSRLGPSITPDSDEIARRIQVLDSNKFTAEKAWVDALVADGFTRANAIQAINSVAVACFDINFEGGEVRLVIDNAVNRPELLEPFRGSFYPEDMGLIADRAIDAVLPHRSGVIPLRPGTLGDGVGRGVATGVTETRATESTFASAGRVTEGGRRETVESRKPGAATELEGKAREAGRVVEESRRH
ncbi:MAG: hypothetical protein WC683_03760 [bacterium]